ncbi:hypothetical protein [Streptomyces swartbergensis]|uniref:Zinc-finger domain-containing protein n=1 Tax=Streptomyces swartbergensis TaxID=487165 RepID=A0A243RWH0_9ACTN|nr:hypothetical protein [Streptomyces swartbergensis]OUC99530.1 hypothetical protein CA983_27825 [Streptomyces swartbergensis]
MSEHLADEELVRLVRGTPGEQDPRQALWTRHVDECDGCRARLADWRAVGRAAIEAEDPRTLAVPAFDTLLGPVLAAATADHAEAAGVAGQAPVDAAQPVPAAAPPGTATAPEVPRFPAPWRLAWQLARTEAAMLPRAWAPLTAAGLVAAAVLAPMLNDGRLGLRLFGAVCVLLVLLAALAVASPRRDPRHELQFTLPLPPGTVFLARMAVVLGADLALAVLCSALVGGPGWWPVVADWLGEALLASSLALSLAVRVAPAVGAVAGGSLWLAGVVTGPQGLVSSPLETVLGHVLSTTPWTVAASVLLLAWATAAMRRYPSGHTS